MKTPNFKKIKRNVLLIFTGIFLCFYLGGLRTWTDYSAPLYLLLPLAFAILFTALCFYMKHVIHCYDTGKNSLGLRLILTVHRYRFLIEQLVVRDFKIKYKRSILGVFWSFLNPLLMMIVQYIVFSQLLNLRGGVEHYAIYLLTGIVVWNGFNDCTQQSMRSIIGNSSLITKVYVPKGIYPMTKVFSSFINVLLSMIPLLLVSLIYGLFSTPHLYLNETVLLLPFGLLFLLVFCVGMGFLFSSLMVFFRDIEFLWSVISTIWMYGTPIIYSLDMFENAAWLVKIMKLNPLYHFITFFRTIILTGTSPQVTSYGICALCALLMFALGSFVFKKTQDKFILYL